MRRVESWLAHLADRLAHRRDGLTDRYRARGRRLAEGVWDGWYRFTDLVGDRWDRLTDRYRARRGRLAEGFWDGWYRFTDLVGDRWDRLTDRYQARRGRLSSQRAERRRQSVARPTIMLGAILCVVLVVTAAVMVRVRTAPPAPPNAAWVKASRAAARGINIPDVRGMPASNARGQLERAGLKFGGARAAIGTPGQVLWTRPSIGHSVPPDTPVTIVIGVEAERIGSASQ